MKDNDNIKELFSEKLGNFASQVNPEVWAKISSQLGSASTTAVGGLSVLSKVIIGVAAISVITVATVLVLNSPKESDKSVVSTNLTEDIIKENVKSPDTLVEEANSVDTSASEKEVTSENDLASESVADPLIPEMIKEIPQDQNFRSDVQPIKKKTETKPETILDKEKDASIINEPLEKPKEFTQRQENSSTTEALESPQEQAYTLGTLPNTFTPNGDGKNDVLFIESSGLEDFTFVVLNSKQQVVYETSDVNFKWDGTTLQGNPIENGVYSYYFIARDKLGAPVKKFMKLSVHR